MSNEDDEWRAKFEALRQNIEQRPNDGMAWLEFAEFLDHESENPQLAVRAYERARDLLPAVDLRLKLGRAYVRSGKGEEGISLIQAAIAERPRANALCFAADAFLYLERPLDAEAAARAAIATEPAFEEGYLLLGESLKYRDRAAAIEAFRAALSLDPKYALAWQGLGRELLQSGEVQEAVDALRNAIKFDQEDVWSHVYLANSLWRLGRLTEARDHYAAAVALDPESQELRQWQQEFQAAVSGRKAGKGTQLD